MTPLELYHHVQQLQLAYVHAIDEDRLEDLPALFVEDCEYSIVSRENVALGLPMPLFRCGNRNMLQDRIVSLRHANLFNPHYSRHVLGPARMLEPAPLGVRTSTAFSVYQTTMAGESRLFGVGSYEDTVVFGDDGQPRFAGKTVRLDTFSIPNLLSTPL
jgi:anthranilate 1,2-dioxygenase small subunit